MSVLWLQGDVDVVYWADFTPATDDTHTLVSGGHDHIKVGVGLCNLVVLAKA